MGILNQLSPFWHFKYREIMSLLGIWDPSSSRSWNKTWTQLPRDGSPWYIFTLLQLGSCRSHPQMSVLIQTTIRLLLEVRSMLLTISFNRAAFEGNGPINGSLHPLLSLASRFRSFLSRSLPSGARLRSSLPRCSRSLSLLPYPHDLSRSARRDSRLLS